MDIAAVLKVIYGFKVIFKILLTFFLQTRRMQKQKPENCYRSTKLTDTQSDPEQKKQEWSYNTLFQIILQRHLKQRHGSKCSMIHHKTDKYIHEK